jgi:hypothetical protein
MDLPENVKCTLNYPHGRFVAQLSMRLDTQEISLGFNIFNGTGWFYLFEDLPIDLKHIEPWLEPIYFHLGEGNIKLGMMNWQIMLTRVGKLADEIHNKALMLAKILEAQRKRKDEK